MVIISKWAAKYTKRELFQLGQELRQPFGAVQNVAEVTEDEHVKQREFLVPVPHPEVGTVKYPGAPYKLSRTRSDGAGPPPFLAEHNNMVYRDLLGFSRDYLDKLNREGVI